MRDVTLVFPLVSSGDLARQWRAQGREYTAYLDASESLCPKEVMAYTRYTVWQLLTIDVLLVVDRHSSQQGIRSTRLHKS